MNFKHKANKNPDAGEEHHAPREGLVNHLSSGLTRVGSVFKQLLNAQAPSKDFSPEDPQPGTTHSTTPRVDSAHAVSASAPPANANQAATAADLRQHIADDHAWIRQNLERHYRGRQITQPPDSPPITEPMDEAAVRARLLKIHGGRLPGRTGRQSTDAALAASRPDPDLSYVQTSTPQVAPPSRSTAASPVHPGAQGTTESQPARPTETVKHSPLVISSKPRSSPVKPVPANLRKHTPPMETAPAAPTVTPLKFPDAETSSADSTQPEIAITMFEAREPAPVQTEAPPTTTAFMPQPVLTKSTLWEREILPTAPPAPSRISAPASRRPAKASATRKPISASISAPSQPRPTVSHLTTRAEEAEPTPPSISIDAGTEAPEACLEADSPPTASPQMVEPVTRSLAEESPPTPEVSKAPSVKPHIVLRPTISVAMSSPPEATPPVPGITAEMARPAPLTAPLETLTAFMPRNWANYAPPLSLLQAASEINAPIDQEALSQHGRLIEEKLGEYRVKVAVRDAYAGPVITRYEVEPAVGVRGAQVVNLMKDLARALSVTSIRVVETIPGKTYMGLELPNVQRQMIRLSEVLSSDLFQHHPSKLAMALGKDITGEPVVADLAKAPHMLVAGTTGSGKSVGVNAMILSLLYRATPDEVRFVMIDPKMLELSVYDGIPHLLAPVVTDMKLAANALHWCVTEMERRYRLMSMLGVRNLSGFNQKIREAEAAGRTLYDPDPLVPESPTPLTTLPFIVVVVDEFADLMMVAGKKIEELIARLAQKARAAGIHLILATQRPSVDVITGLIKANIPTRIAFQVSSKVDSRTILDQMGAETLLGQGDMLYLPPGTGYPQRVHGAFVADDEVHALAEHLKQYGTPDYIDAVLGAPPSNEAETGGGNNIEENDPLYDQAVAIVIESRRASISLVQRHLRIGYNRAARLVEQMEVAGIVSPMESNGSRTVLVPNN